MVVTLIDSTLSMTMEVKRPTECPFSRVFPSPRLDLSPPPTTKPTMLQSLVPLSLMKQGFEGEWINDIDGLDAMAALSNQQGPGRLALPDASPRTVQAWCDVYNSVSETKASFAMIDSRVPVVDIPVQDTKPRLLVSDDSVARRMQSWVQRLLVEQGICPFTKSVSYSGQGLQDVGIRPAPIDYRTSTAVTPDQLLLDSLEALRDFDHSEDSSVLMSAPAFDDEWEYWSGPYFAQLQAALEASQATERIGVVCFHPRYQTPDGSTWPGFGHMHSVPRLLKWSPSSSWSEAAAGGAWQRRTPHAMLNLLRASQLAAAESKRKSSVLYPANIAKLMQIGSERLQKDLDRERSMQ